jgi:hypothetical protein
MLIQMCTRVPKICLWGALRRKMVQEPEQVSYQANQEGMDSTTKARTFLTLLNKTYLFKAIKQEEGTIDKMFYQKNLFKL